MGGEVVTGFQAEGELTCQGPYAKRASPEDLCGVQWVKKKVP